MPDGRYPIEMITGVPVVTAPNEIDVTTAEQLHAVLLEAAAHGHTTFVVDMTRTQFCDSAGFGVLVRAHLQARKEGGQVRLVFPADGAVYRLFALTSLYRLIPRFGSLSEALPQRSDAAIRSSPSQLSSGLRSPADRRGARSREYGQVSEARNCEQCGAVFAPRREHARFCGARCRAAWNREHRGDPAAEASALQWSVAAMTETIERLPTMRASDRTRAIAAIGEAVWQVTLVDATLVRHHPDTYDRSMAGQTPAQRRLIEETLGGLRFVRNHIGQEASLAGFIRADGPGAGRSRITNWSWQPVPEPVLASLAPRRQTWELARYRAYQRCLAGHPIGPTFGRAAEFLNLAAANALSITGTGAHARQ
jgi:anti-sigma B factor antagonist